MRKIFKLVLGVVALFTFSISWAKSETNSAHLDASGAFQKSRISLQGFLGSYAGGSGDIMLPLFWNGEKAVFFDVAGHYQTKTNNWILGPGIGYRQIFKQDGILGGYLFLDYNKFKDEFSNVFEKKFLVFNPGFEYIASAWDLHFNGYLPMAKKHELAHEDWADKFGFFESERFIGHTMFNQKIKSYIDFGTGMDVAIGITTRNLPALKTYFGGYYFNQRMSDDDLATGFNHVSGVFAKLDLAVNSWSSIYLHDSYDNNQHNTVTIGLDFTFGGAGKGKINDDLAEHLMDPIVRDETANSYGLSTTQTMSKVLYADSSSGFDMELDNIYFFKDAPTPIGAIQDGSFEHPYYINSGEPFDQTLIDALPEQANFFINGPTSGISTFGMLDLIQEQSIYGRTTDFALPAQSGNRPLFLGGINLGGGNNVLDSIIIRNQSGVNLSGIKLNSNTSGVKLNNLLIGVSNSGPTPDATKSYAQAVVLNPGASAAITDSTIYAYSNLNSDLANGIDGILLLGANNLSISDSFVRTRYDGNDINNLVSAIKTSPQTGTGDSYLDITSVDMESHNTQSINNSYGTSGIYANGILYANHINVSYSTISAFMDGTTSATTGTQGIYIYGGAASNSTLNIEESTVSSFSASLVGGFFPYSMAIKSEGGANITLETTNLTSEGNLNVYGLFANGNFGPSNIFIPGFGDVFNVINNNSVGNAYGIYVPLSQINLLVFVLGNYPDSTYNITGGGAGTRSNWNW